MSTKTDLTTISTRMNELTDFLIDCSESYYKDHVSKISDQEFDQKLQELDALEHEYPQLKRFDSPTIRPGNDLVRGFKELKHLKPMLSLENTYNEEDVIKFFNKVIGEYPYASFIVEYKIDGLSISCIYKNGELWKAVTRGDGQVGDEVTTNIKYVHDIPFDLNTSRYISVPPYLELRGEVFMRFSEFEKTNQIYASKGLPLLANPRNAASGTLKSLDENVFNDRTLHALFYQTEFISFETHRQMFSWLDEFEIAHAPIYICNDRNPEKMLQQILEAIATIDRMRHMASFPTDGAVIKVNEYDVREKMGYTSKCPRWAKAYKFNPNQIETIIKGITIQVGRTGVLTPVAELEPVTLDGSVIKRASLHNDDMIRLHDFRIGDTVVIEKAGEVIPQVVRTVRHARNSQKFYINEYVNNKCPCCGGPIARVDGMTAWRCTNEACPARLREQLEYLSSKHALDIDGIGNVISNDLVSQGKVKNISDLFNLKQNDLSYLGVNGQKIYQSIQDARNKDLADWITALGISGVGPIVAKSIATKYHDLADFYENYEVTNPDSVVENNIKEYLKNDTLIATLLEQGINPVSHQVTNTALRGKVFVITGKLSLPRHEIEKQITNLGGTVSNSVSSNTSYLVQGEDDRVSSKTKKAEKLKIPIITEQELQKLLTT